MKRYSSGMYVRLAFAVAAHLEPEILIVDEVLAVGDAEFQKKCLGKMGEVAHERPHGPVRQPQHGGDQRPHDLGDLPEAGPADDVRRHRIGHRGVSRRTCPRRQAGGPRVGLLPPQSREGFAGQAAVGHRQRAAQELPEVQMQDDVNIAVRMEVNSVVTGANMTLNLRKADGTLVTTVFSWDQDFRLDLQSGTTRSC